MGLSWSKGSLVASIVAAAVLALFATPGRAVTITEFEIEVGAPPGTHVPYYIHAGPDGNLWFAQWGAAPGIGRVTPAGQMLGVIPEPLKPIDVTHGPDGTVYWAGADGIGRRLPSGTVESLEVGDGKDAYTLSVNAANQILWTGQRPSGSADVCYFEIAWEVEERCSSAGGVVTSRVTGLVTAGDGTLWAALYEANVVRRLTGTADALVNLPLPPGSGPARIALSPDGRAWVTMYDANAIDSFMPDGARQRFPLPAGTAPNDIAYGPDGALWFTGYKSGTIGRMTLGGAVTIYPLQNPNAEPVGIAAGPDNNVWFTEQATGRIGRIVLDPPPGHGAGGDSVAPSFTAPPRFSPKRFAVPGKGAPKGVPKGSKLTFALSEPATVVATIARRLPGRRAGKNCIAPGKAKPKASKCTRFLTRGALTTALAAGAGSIAFNGKLRGRTLPAGTYRATVSAKDGAGNLSPARFAGFTIVAPARS